MKLKDRFVLEIYKQIGCEFNLNSSRQTKDAFNAFLKKNKLPLLEDVSIDSLRHYLYEYDGKEDILLVELLYYYKIINREEILCKNS